MKRKQFFGTFYQSEDGEIIWVNVYYAIDRIYGDPDMYHLSVMHYQSGDITEYVSEEWMKKFEEMAWIDYKDKEDRYYHFVELTFDYHNDDKIAAMHVVKMMDAGFTNDQIIDKLSEFIDDVWLKLKTKIEYSAPPPIIVTAEAFQKMKENIKPNP